jgi:omega-6 fatty acid desaturase (delta-12 desaturase)
MPWAWKKEWRSVALNNLALFAVGCLFYLLLDWRTLLLVHLPVVAIAGAMGVWLFYVQHCFEEAYWVRRADWDPHAAAIDGSSFYDLPAVLRWITCNIGYHHIHHLSSRIPNYRLAEAFRENPEMQRVTRLTLRESLRCARLRLWDEDKRTMVGWRELRQTASLPVCVPSPAETSTV